MSLELLNTELIEKIRLKRGVQISWFGPYLGISRTSVYQLLNNGVIPKEPKKRQIVLMRLASWAQMNVSDLVIKRTIHA